MSTFSNQVQKLSKAGFHFQKKINKWKNQSQLSFLIHRSHPQLKKRRPVCLRVCMHESEWLQASSDSAIKSCFLFCLIQTDDRRQISTFIMSWFSICLNVYCSKTKPSATFTHNFLRSSTQLKLNCSLLQTTVFLLYLIPHEPKELSDPTTCCRHKIHQLTARTKLARRPPTWFIPRKMYSTACFQIF